MTAETHDGYEPPITDFLPSEIESLEIRQLESQMLHVEPSGWGSRLRSIGHDIKTLAEFAISLPFLSFPDDIRKEIGQRDQWKCVECGRSFFEGWLVEMNHITPEYLGGPQTTANGQTLCLEDHKKYHEAREEYGAARLIQGRIDATCGGHTRYWIEKYGA